MTPDTARGGGTQGVETVGRSRKHNGANAGCGCDPAGRGSGRRFQRVAASYGQMHEVQKETGVSHVP